MLGPIVLEKTVYRNRSLERRWRRVKFFKC